MSGKFKFQVKQHLEMSYYVNFLGLLGSNGFQLKWRFDIHGNWKNQNPGVRFGANVCFIKICTKHSSNTLLSLVHTIFYETDV